MSSPLTRQAIEEHEQTHLAPFAVRSAESRGRVYPFSEHPLRTAFQRDRDRIIHSAAFRRLEYKTQVFIPHERDHFRTRLTHTIEVAQIARTLARNLRLNEDLTEAIALVHDLGHTPFGHSGEEVLDGLLADRGGFNHNRQSLRIVDLLEQRYHEHPGLNLTYEVREGIVTHETSVTIVLPEFSEFSHPTLEASLVDIADEIAYNSHDIDDGLSSGILTFEMLSDCSFWSGLREIPAALTSPPCDQARYDLVRSLIDQLATDVITETQRRIDRLGINDMSDVRACPERICAYSDRVREAVSGLKQFLLANLYRHPKLQAMSDRARETMETIFTRLSETPDLMPGRFREMLLTEEAPVVISDYIAGMTDRYAEKVFRELTEG